MSDVNNLLAEIDAEFGKKKKEPGQKKVRGSANVDKITGSVTDSLTREVFANITDWRLSQLMHDSNRTAKDADYGSNWQAEARITWMTRQHCFTCGDYTDFISGEYVRFRNTRQHATVTRRTEACTDLWHFGTDLPEEYVDQEQDVQRCVGCIKVERMAEEIWNKAIKLVKEEQAEIELEVPGL